VGAAAMSVEHAREVVKAAADVIGERNRPTAAGQVAQAYATLAVAEQLERLNAAIDELVPPSSPPDPGGRRSRWLTVSVRR
jgi:hypothetical protein